MAGKKEKERFLFFKYVPPKKAVKPLKAEEYKKVNEPEAECLEPPAEYFDPSYDLPCPEEPVCPEEPYSGECPELPDYPECPEVPEYPEYPECPDIPECPEYPEYPECPEEEEPVEQGPCPENAIMHVVQAGDTFWKLAKKHGSTVEAIAAANPNVDPLNLQIGETLCIPIGIPGAKG